MNEMVLSNTGLEQVAAKRERIDALLREGVRRQMDMELLEAAKIALNAAERCFRAAQVAEKRDA